MPLILSIIDTEVTDATPLQSTPAPRVEETVAPSEEATFVETALKVHTRSTVVIDVVNIHVGLEMKSFEVTLSVL